MTRIRLKYVDAFVGRHGEPRHYFRRKPGPRIPLPGKPGSEEFMEAYKTALAGAAGKPKPEVARGTFDDLCGRYYRSPGFLELEEITRKNYRRVIDGLRDKVGKNGARFGALQGSGLRAEHIKSLMAELSDRPGAAYSLRRVLKNLFSVALDQSPPMLAADPMAGIKAPKGSRNGPGIRPLTQEDIQKFRDFHALGTKPRLALELLYNTAGRRKDAVRLGRKHIVAGEFSFTASKNGVEVAGIPIFEMTQAAIDAMGVTGFDTLLVTDYGKPFSELGFTGRFKAWCAAAGLPDQSSPHGVRKAVLTQMAEDGATAHQIMAVAGHMTLQEAERYTKMAERKRMARAGMGMLVKPQFPTRKSGVGKSGEKP